MSEKQNVIIASAGPVGFLTALGLARQAIEITVLDAEHSDKGGADIRASSLAELIKGEPMPVSAPEYVA